MMKVAVTGASGFIGSRFIERARGRFDLHPIVNDRQGNMIALSDQDALGHELDGCEAIVHCAHYGAVESLNAKWADAICAAAARAGVRRIVAFGSFVTYDNHGETITEQSNGCQARIPYVIGKEQLESAFSRGLNNHPSLSLALLQPSIVVGEGGSWDRFARKLTQTERICLPAGGAGICNAVDVDVVAEAVCRSLELSAAAFGPSRIVKALVSGRQATTWAQWLKQTYGIPASRISACNTNAWAEDTKRNLMLSIRFSSLGASLFEKLKGKPAAEPVRRPLDQRTESVPVPVPFYIPEGLDRLTMSCRGVVDPGRALALGLLD